VGKEHVAHVAFNRGLLSKYGLARLDLKVAALAAETMTNWMPRTLGSMMLRPGLQYIGPVKDNLTTILVPFIFGTTDSALLELTTGASNQMRVWIGDALVLRPNVTTTIAEPTFATLVSWTDIDETATVSNNTGGKLNLTGNGHNSAGRRQQVTVPAGSINVQHRLRIVVERGPVTFRCGSTAGGDEYIEETRLRAGVHSLAFTPTASPFFVEFTSASRAVKLVTSIQVEPFDNGIFELPISWVDGELAKLRWDQSGDVIFVTCDGVQTKRIERRENNSWSIVEYAPPDGPFLTENISTTMLSTSAGFGDITLTASRKFFRATHVGALFQLTQGNGQTVQHELAGADQYTDPVRVTGVGNPDRNYTIAITPNPSYVGSLTLQRSLDNGVTWTEFFAFESGQNQPEPGKTETEPLDNQDVLLRIGFVGTDYTSGSVIVRLSASGGGGTGVVRVTGYVSPTAVNAAVQEPAAAGGIGSTLGPSGGTVFWAEGAWSDRQGYPQSVALFDGRLWFSGMASLWGSISDAYESHDDAFEGDAGPINRTIGSGPVDNINWLLGLAMLVMGADGSEIPARASTQDEALTNTNIRLKATSNQGSAAVPAVKVDEVGFFVQRSGSRLMQLALSDGGNYVAKDQSIMIYDSVFPGIKRLAVQRQPDTRVHCVLDDGRVGILVFDKAEEVEAWVIFEAAAIAEGACTVEDVAVLPGQKEDQVYYVVNRIGTVQADETMPNHVGKIMAHIGADGEVTSINGADVLVDALRNRMFVFREGGTVGISGIRRFDQNMGGSETMQQGITDLQLGVGNTVDVQGSVCLDPAGNIIMGHGVSNTMSCGKINPVTLVQSAQFGTASGFLPAPFTNGTGLPSVSNMCAVRNVDGDDFLVAAGGPNTTHTATFVKINDMTFAGQAFDPTEQQLTVCAGLPNTGIAYGLGCNATFPSATALGLYRYTCGPGAGDWVPTVPITNWQSAPNTAITSATIGTISPSAFDATWTQFTNVGGIVFDHSDGNILLMVEGNAGAGATRYIAKINVTTAAVMWVQAINEFDARNRYNMNRCHVDGTYAYYAASGGPNRNLYLINTTTGALVGGAAQVWTNTQPTSAQVWNGLQGAIAVFGSYVDGTYTLPSGEVGDYFDGASNDSTTNQWHRIFAAAPAAATSLRVRAIEKWAREDECRGTTLNKQADAFVIYSGPATLTVTGLDHLDGQAVCVWADGTDRSPDVAGVQTLYTVAGGAITVTVGPAFTSAIIGLPYTAQYKSSKLAYGSQMGSALNQSKIINQLGLLLADTHNRGLKYGQDFAHLDAMPLIENMNAVGADVVHSAYDEDPFPLNGTWDTDSRLCLQANAPRPCNVLAALMVLEEHDKG
jgi:hypothetical protein